MRRPPTNTIKQVVEWLEEQGIHLYGQNMDTNSGCQYQAQRDYSWEDAIKRYNHIRNDTLWNYDD